MTVEALKDCNKKALARMAKEQGVVGWHAMRKDQLIKALSNPGEGKPHEGNGNLGSSPSLGSGQGSGLNSHTNHRPAPSKPLNHHNGSGPFSPIHAAAKGSDGSSLPTGSGANSASEVHTPIRGSQSSSSSSSGYGTQPQQPLVRPKAALDHSCDKDRIILVVRDPYWLHAYWELSRSTLDRAKAAMKQDWHSAKPILRVLDVTSEEITSAIERHVRDIEIHGEVNNWYIDVPTPPRSFRVDIGYLAKSGTFYVLSRSNLVTTPKTRMIDLPGADNGRRNSLQWPTEQEREAYSSIPKDLRDLYEQRLHQPVHTLSLPNIAANPAASFGRDFNFQIDAELIVYGRTEPNAKVTLQGEAVKLRSDGTFSVRFSLPDSRQIIPAVAASPDGIEERTIVLAVERNTKTLEPQIHDVNDL